jgi:hypothetical protein
MTLFWNTVPCILVKFTHVSKVLIASIIRAMSAPIMLHGAIPKKTVIFVLAAVRT